MLKSVLAGLVLENVETLRQYRTKKDDELTVVNDISDFINNIIKSLPWYYHLPIKVLIFIIGLLSLIVMRQNLNSLPQGRRAIFFRYIRFIPFFTTLHELIRSLTFLRLFDVLPFIPDDLQEIKIKKG